jgi:UDP-3-O-[3-hydroxymyristoyl] glucosamine N-acyltransferase
VAPFAVIGDDVTIGRNGAVHPHAVIGDGVVMGDDVIVGPNVHIGHGCRIGSRVTIQAGTVIGADGFGWAPEGSGYQKIPHTGIVRIDDDVEIGACNTIDRGTFGETRIRRGVKTDNLVHVAHNVTVGEDTLLVAQVGIAGSTAIGRHAVLAGQVGVSGHLTIGDNVTIGPQAGIGKPIDEGEVVSGSPGIPHRLWLRVQRIVPLLPEIKKRLDAMEKRLKRIEDNG